MLLFIDEQANDVVFHFTLFSIYSNILDIILVMTSLLFSLNDTQNIECHGVVSIYMDDQQSLFNQCTCNNTDNNIVKLSSLLKLYTLTEVPSTRKQKAKEKRSRQSDVMSDIENLDVMLGNYQENEQSREGNISDREIDLELDGQQTNTISVERNFRSLLNSNRSENCEIAAGTSRAINSEISSQMSRKLEEMKSDLKFPYRSSTLKLKGK